MMTRFFAADSNYFAPVSGSLSGAVTASSATSNSATYSALSAIRAVSALSAPVATRASAVKGEISGRNAS
jgi:hypothetical protein